MRFVGPLAAILLITALSWLLVAVHVAPVVPGRWTTVLLLWVLSAVPIFVLVRNFTTGRYPSAVTRLWMFRPFWYTQLLMLALALLATIAFVVGLPWGVGTEAGRWTAIVGAAALGIAGLWGYVGSRRLVTRAITLSHPKVPARLDGLRIVQLSDLHVGPQTSRSQLQRISEMTRSSDPHIIAYTGDQVDDHPADVDAFASAFATLTRVDVWWVIVYFALAALCAAAGLHLRAHAALIAAAVYTILFVSKAQADDLLPFAPEWRFILGGAILLAASALIARLLRDRTRGLTVTPEDLTAYDKEIEILATIAAQPQVEAPPEKGGGGGFGGAGATGDF